MYYIIAYMNSEYSEEVRKFLEKLDGNDTEIHIYNHQQGEMFEPRALLMEEERIIGEKKQECKFVFLTNIKNLMDVVYRIYHQSFENFVFFADGAEDILLPELYRKIMKVQITQAEQLYKPIYCDSLEYALKMGEWAAQLEEADYAKIRSLRNADELQKSYCIDGEAFVFEPILGRGVTVNGEACSNHPVQYMYSYNERMVSEIEIALKTQLFKTQPGVLELLFRIFENEKYKAYMQYKMTLLALHEKFKTNEASDGWKERMFFYSYLLVEEPIKSNYDRLLKFCIENMDKMSEHELNCLCHQIDAVILKYPYLREEDPYLRILQHGLVERSVEHYRLRGLGIPQKDRNKDEVMVITTQFLSEDHAPTKTVLERVYTLGAEMGKKVTLINAKEYLDISGGFPFYNMQVGNVIEGYALQSNYVYKGYEFEFYQPEKSTREETVVCDILERVIEKKPEYVLYIGNFSVLSEVIAQVVPVIHIPVNFTKIFYKKYGCLVAGKQYSEMERRKISSLGYDVDQIIESTFTFELKKQKNHWRRKEKGLPEDKFLCLVIGLRLTDEVTEEFVKAMQPLFEHNVHFVFAGNMHNYDEMCELFPSLYENSTYMGYCDDILALTELCDLYVNPKRLGGGFSIIESFIHKKPGITLNYGDVAGAAGAEFIADSYEDMVQKIIRYAEDTTYYVTQAEKAYARAKQCTDSKRALNEIIEKVKKHKSYY